MRRSVCHEQLIEGAKAAGQARRQTNQPEQLLLVTTELADDRQKVVEIKTILRDISWVAILTSNKQAFEP